jgi:F0F1-type ATP synthase assembly protein I
MTFRTKANLKKRIIATILDYGLFMLATYLYIMLVGHNDEEGVKTVTGLLALPIPTAWFIYFVVIEACYGATLAHQGLVSFPYFRTNQKYKICSSF